MAEPIDRKPRSREVTDGLERAAARGMLRAVGMRDEDFAKPQIGIASSWNEITPCNLSLQRLGIAAKEGVHRGRRVPDGVRHHLGLRRHLHGARRHALVAGLAGRSSPTRWRPWCRPSGSTAPCCWPAATRACPGC